MNDGFSKKCVDSSKFPKNLLIPVASDIFITASFFKAGMALSISAILCSTVIVSPMSNCDMVFFFILVKISFGSFFNKFFFSLVRFLICFELDNAL